MRVIREEISGGERVLALGTFDGVHRGHQALLAAGKRYAEEQGILLRACSFDRHPLEILRPELAPKLLTTPEEKEELMAAYGVDELQLMPFTRETADMAPEAFLQYLREGGGLRAVVAGWNYTFGKGGKGTARTLEEDGKAHGYEVMIIPPVKTAEGETISSTLIRERLREGRIEEAEVLMGHPFELRGRVEGGKHMGRRIGVATANVETDPRKQLPAFGVYPCRVKTEAGEMAAVMNIGVQPTLPSGRVTVEAHILEGEPELYGQEVSLFPGDRFREEKKFDSVQELTNQIRKDQEAARAWFQRLPDGKDGRKTDSPVPCVRKTGDV